MITLSETPSGMASLLTDLGTVATNIFSQIGNVASAIVGNPIILFTVGFLFVGGCIGIFGRLLSRR